MLTKIHGPWSHNSVDSPYSGHTTQLDFWTLVKQLSRTSFWILVTQLGRTSMHSILYCRLYWILLLVSRWGSHTISRAFFETMVTVLFNVYPVLACYWTQGLPYLVTHSSVCVTVTVSKPSVLTVFSILGKLSACKVVLDCPLNSFLVHERKIISELFSELWLMSRMEKVIIIIVIIIVQNSERGQRAARKEWSKYKKQLRKNFFEFKERLRFQKEWSGQRAAQKEWWKSKEQLETGVYNIDNFFHSTH